METTATKPSLMDRERKSFYDSHSPNALREAQIYAGQKGFVATMPQLLQMKVLAPKSDALWKNWYTTTSEELVGKSKQGTAHVVLVHNGIFSNPERIETAYKEDLIRGAGRLNPTEFQDILEGKLPNGRTLQQVYSFDEFLKNGVPEDVTTYAVVMDFDKLKKLSSGDQKITRLYDNPLVIARAGGEAQAQAYLDKVKKLFNRKELGVSHPFNYIVSLDQAQGRLLYVINGVWDCKGGLVGYGNLDGDGRYVGVAPEARDAKKSRSKISLEDVAKELK